VFNPPKLTIIRSTSGLKRPIALCKDARVTGLSFKHITYAYNRAEVLHDLSVSADGGKITCLLGPSGCGKTTLMKLAAGILPMQGGEILLDGRVMADHRRSPPPEKRPIGVVFQEGALFPHLTVAKNIGFGLKTAAHRDATVSQMIEQVGLTGLEDRYPHMLSGGQQQRVALARALAPQPQVLLLDEPFANIDIVRRKTLRQQTRSLLKSTNRVVVLVTHDPEEALEMADEIAVIGAGQLVQSGSPQTLYDTPRALSVATLIGEAQVLDGVVGAEGIDTPFGIWPLNTLAMAYQGIEGPAHLAIRPADLIVEVGQNAVVRDIRGLRRGVQLLIEAGSVDLTVFAEMTHGLNIGSAVTCKPKPGTLLAYAKHQ